jgi:hypothetical protein
MAYQTISEDIIRQAAEIMGPDSNFHVALKWAEEYRQAGLNPVYYTDDEDKTVFVTTEEKMNGVKFN